MNPQVIIVIALFALAYLIPSGFTLLTNLDRWMAGSRWDAEQREYSEKP